MNASSQNSVIISYAVRCVCRERSSPHAGLRSTEPSAVASLWCDSSAYFRPQFSVGLVHTFISQRDIFRSKERIHVVASNTKSASRGTRIRE